MHPVQILRGALLGASLLLLPATAPAAGFPCAKASTPTERAICADPTLSRLDGQLAAAFRAALKRLSGNGPEESVAQKAAKADQKDWLDERDVCGADVACMRPFYERRLAVLAFNPDPTSPSSADRFLGRFAHDGFMSANAMHLRDGRVAFSVGGAEPKTARWVCSFTGIGRVAPDGSLFVRDGDRSDAVTLTVLAAPNGIRIPETGGNLEASQFSCGNGGTLAFTYPRQR